MLESDMNAAFAAAEKKRDYLVSAPLECNICQEVALLDLLKSLMSSLVADSLSERESV